MDRVPGYHQTLTLSGRGRATSPGLQLMRGRNRREAGSSRIKTHRTEPQRASRGRAERPSQEFGVVLYIGCMHLYFL